MNFHINFCRCYCFLPPWSLSLLLTSAITNLLQNIKVTNRLLQSVSLSERNWYNIELANQNIYRSDNSANLLFHHGDELAYLPMSHMCYYGYWSEMYNLRANYIVWESTEEKWKHKECSMPLVLFCRWSLCEICHNAAYPDSSAIADLTIQIPLTRDLLWYRIIIPGNCEHVTTGVWSYSLISHFNTILTRFLTTFWCTHKDKIIVPWTVLQLFSV